MAKGTEGSHHLNGETTSLAPNNLAGPTSLAASHTGWSHAVASQTALITSIACRDGSLSQPRSIWGLGQSGGDAQDRRKLLEAQGPTKLREVSPALNRRELAAECASLSGGTPGKLSAGSGCNRSSRPLQGHHHSFRSLINFKYFSSFSPFPTQDGHVFLY